MNDPKERPKNREVENEMICRPDEEGQPPRAVTDPGGRARSNDMAIP